MVALSRNAGNGQAVGGGGERARHSQTQHSITVQLLKRDPIPIGETEHNMLATRIPK